MSWTEVEEILKIKFDEEDAKALVIALKDAVKKETSETVSREAPKVVAKDLAREARNRGINLR